MPFTYPLQSLMARTGLRVMTTVGTAEFPVAGPLTMSEKSNDDAPCSAVTFSIHSAAVHANIVLTVTGTKFVK